MGTIFIAGTYGVGKSTLCQKLSEKLNIPFYSAGDLISEMNGEQYGANKFVENKEDNQDVLAAQIKQLLNRDSQLLLVGHFCIFDKEYNIDYLPETVFGKLEIETILLLEAPIEKIINNLSNRDKKLYTHQQIMNLQNAEREQAKKISIRLGCSFNLYNMLFDELDVQTCLAYITKEKL